MAFPSRGGSDSSRRSRDRSRNTRSQYSGCWGGDSLDAWLLSDSGASSPGILIEQFTFPVPPGYEDLMLSAESATNPLITAETRHWLIVSPRDAATDCFGWYRNPSVTGVLNAQGNNPGSAWQVRAGDYAPTLKIMGDPQ
jgi:hypothetical protein